MVALAPDLVVVSRDGTDRAAWEKLTAMGLNVLVTSGTTLDGVLEDVERVGSAIGEPEKAATLVAALKVRIAAAEARGRAHRGKTAVVLVWPDPPVVAGRGTFVGDVLARAGFTNAVPAAAGDWPRVSLETLAGWDPGLVVRPSTSENAEAFANALSSGAFRVVPAVREGRVATLPGDLLERPGPRLVDALEALAALGNGRREGRDTRPLRVGHRRRSSSRPSSSSSEALSSSGASRSRPGRSGTRFSARATPAPSRSCAS